MTILHIDDDEDDRDMLHSAIKNIDPEVQIVSAEDGRVGVKLLKAAKDADNLPCLIILDINMPILDGKKTFEAIRQSESFASLPIVVFTSGSNREDAAYFISREVEVINKPHTMSDLENVAKRLIEYCGK